MKIYNLLGLVISLILAFVGYFATSNIFVGGGILLYSIVFYYLLLSKRLSAHKNDVARIHECYLFINNFLVSLSIKQSLIAAFEAVSHTISDEFYDYLTSIEDLSPQEKLMYLNRYFSFHIYQIFVDIIFLWLEEGGKILDMSSHITNEMREIEEYTQYSISINRRKAVEIGTLWLFSLAIVIALRIALNEYYGYLLGQPLFIASIALLIVIVSISMFILVSKVANLEIRRTSNG